MSDIYNSAGVSNPDNPNTRSNESIANVMNKHSQKIFRIFSRYHRKDNKLAGRVLLEITIAPPGNVTSIRALSSDINNNNLIDDLSKLIAKFEFGAGDVEELIIKYPIEFFPH